MLPFARRYSPLASDSRRKEAERREGVDREHGGVSDPELRQE